MTARLVPLLLLLMLLFTGGCATVGPAAISNGRMVYNEVINYTDDQQILNMIVRERYAQTYGMLSVASVTANVKFSASVHSEFRAWGKESDTDDLVPLAIGAAYEENPTISYIPVQGEAAARSMVTPITIAEGFLAVQASAERDVASRQIYASVNGLQNPASGEASPEFDRLLDLYILLQRRGILDFGQVAGTDDAPEQYFVSLHDYGEAFTDEVQTFLDMLRVEGQIVDGRNLILPLYWSSVRPTPDAIYVELRSAMDLLRKAGTEIELPPPHVASGVVEPTMNAETTPHRFMVIRSSKKRPRHAVVAIPFRDWWYFIDETDPRSKKSFRLLKFIIRMRLDQQLSQQQVPVLTVPVG